MSHFNNSVRNCMLFRTIADWQYHNIIMAISEHAQILPASVPLP